MTTPPAGWITGWPLGCGTCQRLVTDPADGCLDHEANANRVVGEFVLIHARTFMAALADRAAAEDGEGRPDHAAMTRKTAQWFTALTGPITSDRNL